MSKSAHEEGAKGPQLRRTIRAKGGAPPDIRPRESHMGIKRKPLPRKSEKS